MRLETPCAASVYTRTERSKSQLQTGINQRRSLDAEMTAMMEAMQKLVERTTDELAAATDNAPCIECSRRLSVNNSIVRTRVY